MYIHARSRIFVTLSAVAAAGLCAVIGALVLWAWQVDRSTRDREEYLVGEGVKARVAEVAATVTPQVDWDDAVANLAAKLNVDWAKANLTAYLEQNGGFQTILVIGADGRPVYASRDGEEQDPRNAYDPLADAASPLLASIRAAEAARGPISAPAPAKDGKKVMLSKPIQASGFEVVDGRPLLLTASLVQPDFGAAQVPGPRAPVVLTVMPVDGAFARLIGSRFKLDRMATSVAPAGFAAGHAGGRLALTTNRGGQAIVLAWKPQTPGGALLRSSLPFVLLALGLIVGAGVIVVRASNRISALLDEREEEARAAAEAKSRFLSNMSHELRTPMNGVLGALELLRDEPLSAKGQRLVEEAGRSGRLLTQLLNDVVELAGFEAGKVELVEEAIDPAEVVADVVSLLRPQAEAKGLKLSMELPAAPVRVMGDRARLRQALFSLAANAVKFTDRGLIAVRFSADEPADGRRALRFEVQDTGPGIPADRQAALFQGFEQADTSGTRLKGGAGLGLAIVGHLARLMGGAVSFESVEGEGAAFRIALTARAAEPAAEVATPAPEPGEAADGCLSGLEVLVVDDNPTNRTIATMMLQSLGANVWTAEDGIKCVDLVKLQRFDLILMDIQMPRMDGVEATRVIRALQTDAAQTVIVALTANVRPDQQAQYRAVGMQGVLAKPVSAPVLVGELARVFSEPEESAAAAAV